MLKIVAIYIQCRTRLLTATSSRYSLQDRHTPQGGVHNS